MRSGSASLFEKWYDEHRDEIFDDFFTFLRFPSISAHPNYRQETLNTAKWLSTYLAEKVGLTSSLWETSGYPVVFAQDLRAGPHRPTVLIYHHYDVQPVDPLSQWKSDPFEPVIKDGEIYARGASDNKGQCFYTIQAIRAFLELSFSLNINIKVFIEGEEESGSKGTSEILLQKKEELKSDHLLIVDFSLPQRDTPAVTLGMRGILAMDIECMNSSIDLHSGIHGGMVLNPNKALIQLLSLLWNADGQVAIPGFYDDVRSLSSSEKQNFDFVFDEETYKREFGIRVLATEKGFSPLEGNWIRPSLEINGIGGGYTGDGFKTVIPSSALAKLSCRLVPDQDPKKIGDSIAHFLQSHLNKGLELKIKQHQAAASFRTSLNSSIIKTASLVYEEVFEKRCRKMLCGGSVPIVVDLARISLSEAVMIGVALDTDDIHAPNEHFGLDRFQKGFSVIIKILEKLSED